MWAQRELDRFLVVPVNIYDDSFIKALNSNVVHVFTGHDKPPSSGVGMSSSH